VAGSKIRPFSPIAEKPAPLFPGRRSSCFFPPTPRSIVEDFFFPLLFLLFVCLGPPFLSGAAILPLFFPSPLPRVPLTGFPPFWLPADASFFFSRLRDHLFDRTATLFSLAWPCPPSLLASISPAKVCLLTLAEISLSSSPRQVKVEAFFLRIAAIIPGHQTGASSSAVHLYFSRWSFLSAKEDPSDNDRCLLFFLGEPLRILSRCCVSPLGQASLFSILRVRSGTVLFSRKRVFLPIRGCSPFRVPSERWRRDICFARLLRRYPPPLSFPASFFLWGAFFRYRLFFLSKHTF